MASWSQRHAAATAGAKATSWCRCDEAQWVGHAKTTHSAGGTGTGSRRRRRPPPPSIWAWASRDGEPRDSQCFPNGVILGSSPDDPSELLQMRDAAHHRQGTAQCACHGKRHRRRLGTARWIEGLLIFHRGGGNTRPPRHALDRSGEACGRQDTMLGGYRH